MNVMSTQFFNARNAANLFVGESVLRHFEGRNFPALTRLDIEADSGTVTLKGTVRTFYQKQMAITLSMQVEGVTKIVDEIVVQRVDEVQPIRSSQTLNPKRATASALPAVAVG